MRPTTSTIESSTPIRSPGRTSRTRTPARVDHPQPELLGDEAAILPHLGHLHEVGDRVDDQRTQDGLGQVMEQRSEREDGDRSRTAEATSTADAAGAD
jgi:hypothetical protein